MWYPPLFGCSIWNYKNVGVQCIANYAVVNSHWINLSEGTNVMGRSWWAKQLFAMIKIQHRSVMD